MLGSEKRTYGTSQGHTGVDHVASEAAFAAGVAVDVARQALVGAEARDVVVEVRSDTDTLAGAEASHVGLGRVVRRGSVSTIIK